MYDVEISRTAGCLAVLFYSVFGAVCAAVPIGIALLILRLLHVL